MTDGASGDYKAIWAGKTSTGRFTSGSSTGFSFPLPEEGADRMNAPLTLELQAGGKTFSFTRGMEVSKNFGLSAPIPLLRADRYHGSRPNTSDSEVSLRALADPESLTLIYDIDIQSQNLGGKPPFYVEFQLDARGYGKRRNFGFTDFVRVLPLPDGKVKISDIRPSVFGNGYNRLLDRNAIKVERTRLGRGDRLTVTIPRSFFYLHEWALGNGNSLLGLNTAIYVQSGSATSDNIYPEDGRYFLVQSGMSRFNAESFGVLELMEHPTGRWSSRVY
jgi:hypothetical protein